MTAVLALDLGQSTGFALGTDDNAERWRAVPDWPEYQVSDHGRVRRVGRAKGTQRRVLKHWLTLGCPAISLWRDNVGTGVMAHRLVALAFLPPAGEGQTQVAHGDGNRANNHVSNLRWATPFENSLDRHQHGTHTIGEANPGAVLKEADVVEIRRLADGPMLHREIAEMFGITRQTVGDIKNKRRWGHLK